MTIKDVSCARAWAVMMLALLLGGLSGRSNAATHLDIPFYYQDTNAQGNKVSYVSNSLDDVVASAKQYLATAYPPTTPGTCTVQAVSVTDANSLAVGFLVNVGYLNADPNKYTCPSNLIQVRATQYDHDPAQNTGDAGNCNGGVGVPGGDGVVTCPGTVEVADPINLATGNKFEQVTDAQASPALTFQRFYNSEASVRGGALGPQWRHSFERALLFLNTSLTGGGSPYILAQRPDGRGERFTPASGGGWSTGPDKADTLMSDANGYTLFVAGPNLFERYSTSGQLQSITDASGQSTVLSYNGPQLQSVTDPFGRSLQFSYDSSGALRTVTLPDGGSLNYSYSKGMLAGVQYPDHSTRQYLYNEAAQTGGASLPQALTGEIDEAGVRYSTTGYDAQGRAVSSSLAGGVNATSLSISTTGPQMVSPLGKTMGFGVADDGHGAIKLTGAFAPCNAAWCKQSWTSIQYDANGYPSKYVDLSSHTTQVTNNAAGLETQRVEGVGLATLGLLRTTNTTWDSVLRNPITRTVLDSNNQAVGQQTWAYNGTGQVTARCLADPAVTGATSYTCGSSANAPAGVRQWTYQYCTAIDSTQCPVIGLLLSEDGPRTDVSDVTQYRYYLTTDTSGCAQTAGACHQAGDLSQVTDAVGHVTTMLRYDLAGRLTQLSDANGVVTTLTYTPRGWLQTRTVAGATTTYAYTPYGALASVTDADGVAVTYGYDSAHRQTDITDALGNHVHDTLDAAGDVTDEVVYAAGSSTPVRHVSRVFNNLGQLTKVTDGLNQTVFDASGGGGYNSGGQLVQYLDAKGVKHQNIYDGLNRLSMVLDTAAGGQSTAMTSYAYDAAGHVKQITTPDYKSTSYKYDGLGNLITTTSPDTGTTTVTYDAAGNTLTTTDAKGIVVTTTYDATNRPIAVSYADPSLNVAYHYDEPDSVTGCVNSFPSGHLSRLVEGNVTTIYCYDAAGRVTRKSQVQGTATDVITYGYTVAGRLASVGTPSGSAIQYQRDADGRISAITAVPPGVTGATAGNVVTGISYAPFGGVASYILGNGQSVTRTIDPNGRVSDVTSAMLNWHVARDAGGYITALGTGPGATPVLETYTYDWQNRLTGVINAAGTPLEAYTYDAIGDRLSKSGSGQATGTYTYPYSSHWLTATGNAARANDANGNATSLIAAGETFGFGYNGRNQLTVAQRNGVTVGSYTYNALGQRTAKVVTFPSSQSLRFQYDEAGHLQGEYGDNTRDLVWLGDLPVGILDTTAGATSIRYIHADALNVPRAISDATGAAQWQWATQDNPFGEQLPTSATGYTFNLRFPGQYYDAETMLHDNGHRTYDPSTGRYLQNDPLGLSAGWNTYGYVGGNPLGSIDPEGLQVTVEVRDEVAEPNIPVVQAEVRVMEEVAREEARQARAQREWAEQVTKGTVPGQRVPASQYGSQGTCRRGDIDQPTQQVGPISQGGVYTLIDPLTGEVVYAGRTVNFDARRYDHARDPDKEAYRFNPVYRTDDYATQRGLEQTLMNFYSPRLNILNGISPSNPNYDTYMDAAQTYLQQQGGH